MKFRQLEIPTVETMVRHVDPLARPPGGALRGSPSTLASSQVRLPDHGLPSGAGGGQILQADARDSTPRI